jgi:hypothetical protein
MELLNVYCEALKSGVKFKELSEKQLEILRTPLPNEAVKPIPGAAKLSSINVSFVHDLFNEVFGHGGWTIASVVDMVNQDEAVSSVEFLAYEYGIYRQGVGGSKARQNSPMDTGDLQKSSITDATTKLAATISQGINLVWKNMYDENGYKGDKKEFINHNGEPSFMKAKELIQKGEIKNETELEAKFIFAKGTKSPADQLKMDKAKKELIALFA